MTAQPAAEAAVIAADASGPATDFIPLLAGAAEELHPAALDQARSDLERAAETGLAEVPLMVDRIKAGSERLPERATQEFGPSQRAMVDFNAKVVEAWRVNAETTLAYWQRLAGVANWSDLVALNTAHVRQQMEVMTGQMRELAEFAGRAARDGAESLGKLGRPG